MVSLFRDLVGTAAVAAPMQGGALPHADHAGNELMFEPGAEPGVTEAAVDGAAASHRFGARLVFAADAPATRTRRLGPWLIGLALLSVAGVVCWPSLHAAPSATKSMPVVIPPVQNPSAVPGPAPAQERHAPARPRRDSGPRLAERIEFVPAPPESVIEIAHHPARPAEDARHPSAWAALRRGDRAGAAGIWRELLAEDPDNRQALLGLAALESHGDRRAEAQRIYLTLLERDPGDPLAAAGLLSIAPPQDPATRERRLKSLVAEHPDVPALHGALGELYIEQQRWPEARSAYLGALAASARPMDHDAKGDPDLAFNLAVVLEHLARYPEALAQYRTAVEWARDRQPTFDPVTAAARISALEGI